MKTILRKLLVTCFGWLVNTLPRDYQPAGKAFLHSIANTKLNSERPVPEEILPTLAIAVLRSIIEPQDLHCIDFETGVETLDTHTEKVPVQYWDYPSLSYSGPRLLGYDRHPHYYVLGAFWATPLGNGMWEIADRYDWDVPAVCRVPDTVARWVPSCVLCKFACFYNGAWYLNDVNIIEEWTTPYWHRSVVRLSDYLDPQWFE